jgi:hypothetical protein
MSMHLIGMRPMDMHRIGVCMYVIHLVPVSFLRGLSPPKL